MTKIVIPFPVKHHNIDPKEDYFELCRDVCGGDFVSVFGKGPIDVVKEIIGHNVHAHGRGMPFPELSAFFARKSVYTPHNNHLGSSAITRLARKMIFNRYDWIAAQTDYGKRNYIKEGVNPRKIVVLPIPVNYSFFSRPRGGKAFRRMYGLGKDPFVLCINARKTKKPEIIIEACRMAGVRLVFVGHKSKREVQPGFEWLLPEPEILAQESRDVIFTGNLDKYGVLAALDAANIYVNSSEDGGECFSLVVYEAACAGVPLCLPDFGLFENFSGAALFHKNDDPAQLAKNIRLYLDNRSLCKKNSAAAKKIAKKFDYPIVRKMYEKFYRDIGFMGDSK
jgi:glycosyltransferase involved in cell wall biosynthesis